MYWESYKIHFEPLKKKNDYNCDRKSTKIPLTKTPALYINIPAEKKICFQKTKQRQAKSIKIEECRRKKCLRAFTFHRLEYKVNYFFTRYKTSKTINATILIKRLSNIFDITKRIKQPLLNMQLMLNSLNKNIISRLENKTRQALWNSNFPTYFFQLRELV